MFERIYQQEWITLPKTIREHLSKVLHIPTSGICEIRDDIVISDGKTNEDLATITNEVLSNYVSAVGDVSFTKLFKAAIKKATFETTDPRELEIQANKKRYCDTCDAKSGRHRKECPKFT